MSSQVEQPKLGIAIARHGVLGVGLHGVVEADAASDNALRQRERREHFGHAVDAEQCVLRHRRRGMVERAVVEEQGGGGGGCNDADGYANPGV